MTNPKTWPELLWRATCGNVWRMVAIVTVLLAAYVLFVHGNGVSAECERRVYDNERKIEEQAKSLSAIMERLAAQEEKLAAVRDIVTETKEVIKEVRDDVKEMLRK